MSEGNDYDMDQFRATYFEECQDLINEAENRLMAVQQALPDIDSEDLHGIFRAVHSVKGGAGAFRFLQLVNFAHIYETLLDLLREDPSNIDDALLDTLLAANDILAALISAAEVSSDLPEDRISPIADALQETIDFLSGNNTGGPGENKDEDAGWGLFDEGNLEPTSKHEDRKDQSGDDGEDDESWGLFEPIDLPTPSQNDEDDGWGLFEPISGSDSTPITPDTMDKDDQGWGLFEPVPVESKPLAPTPEDEQGWGLFEPYEQAQAHGSQKQFKIQFIPKLELMRFANDPLLMFRELASMGQLKIIPDLSSLPNLSQMKPEDAYISWTLAIQGDVNIASLSEVFEFVEDDCHLDITPLTEDEFNHFERESTSSPRQAHGSEATFTRRETPPATKALSTAKPRQATAKPKTSTVTKDETDRAKAPPKPSSIRVDLDRVDKLVNMVGELVITQAMLRQQAESLPANHAHVMAQGFEDLSMHTRELQESVMAIRMQPVKSVFSRMPRLVRELATKLGKKIDLITTGENTEVDKTVVELLADPLTHMIRNSLDHGIETPEQRVEAGKAEKAQILLSAEHRSGRIVIEIIDDGQGINRERVLDKAMEKGLVAPDANLSPEQIDELIFMPGFSTADAVTDVSGRGVGMDVVRKNISNLGGRIAVSSMPGQGTKFTMSLPLTLAVLDGMIVSVGSEKYVIPLTSIEESIRPMPEELSHLTNGTSVVSVRGHYIRLVYLHKIFGIDGAEADPSKGLVVIVDVDGGNSIGIVVDELLGQQQVVIKTLEANYDPVEGISAATILGNGRVALILDIDGLGNMAPPQHRKSLETASQISTITNGEEA